MGSNATDLIDSIVETSILGENDKTEIPIAREVATVETSLDDISEQMLQASTIQTSKEHDLVSLEVGETTGKAPEKDEVLYEKAETSLAEETTEATDGENLDHPLPVGKLEKQIQLSSSSYESTKEEAAKLDKSELEKFKDLSSKLPTTEHMRTTIETSEANEVLVEEAKTSEAISEPQDDGFEEFKEIGSSPPVEKIRTYADEVELNETKTLDAVYKSADVATNGENLGHPLPVGKLEEKIQLSSSSYESTKEDATELDKSELEESTDKLSKLSTTEHGIRHVGTTIEESEADEVQVEEAKTSEAISKSKEGQPRYITDEENIGLKKCSTDSPSQYEERPVQQSLQEASRDEDIVYSKNSNKDADNLPTPYPTVTEHSTEDIGGKYEEASNLELEKNGEVLLESVSAINSPAVPLTSEGIEVIEETPKESTTELGDGENHCEETTEEEAIKKYTSTEKEETTTKINQEDELGAEDYPGERTSTIFEAEDYPGERTITIFDASINEIQHEKESEENCANKNMEGVVRADDKGPHQLSASDEIANQSELESHRDEIDFTDTATEATAQFEELRKHYPRSIRKNPGRSLNYCEMKTTGILLLRSILLSYLRELDASWNQLTGSILVGEFKNLERLVISYNYFSGPMPSSRGRMSYLRELDARQNQLNGSIPVALEQLSNLQILDLSNNSLDGMVFKQHFTTLKNLTELRLSSNSLVINISSQWVPPFQLQLLRTASYTLGPQFPSWFQTQRHVTELDMSNANISDIMPDWFELMSSCIQYLNISNNHTRGKLPKFQMQCNDSGSVFLSGFCFHGELPLSSQNLTGIVTLDLDENAFIGVIQRLIGDKLHNLVILSLQSNNFYGGILVQLCHLSALQLLNLAHNNVTGDIPSCFLNFTTMAVSEHGNSEYQDSEKIGDLKQLESLDFSRNKLFGSIPQSLSSLTSLSHLNLSFNNLSGQIPIGNQLQTLDDQSIYVGNDGLCGAPLTKSCPGDESADDGDRQVLVNEGDRDEDDAELMWFYAGIGPGFVVGLLGVFCTLYFKRKWRYAYFQLIEDAYDRIFVAIAVKANWLRRKFHPQR
ncbi:hypothetical protein RHSIM_RhsimUnG0134000 [Rhododendron simsii]|uniref:Uncharacterized protein n=1 Tax=Rhododendron simsii TaxID=118357 RepID=A0A834L478_RHOSS|nr:hypothetical protein RHSIM_RhsimUnG0134000 [Rhododendron simsii]